MGKEMPDISSEKPINSPEPYEFQMLGFQFEKIIGVTTDPGELTFAIKFKGKEETELIPARIANMQYPEQIIEYYEQRLVWEIAPFKYERVKLHRKDKKQLFNGKHH